MASPVPGPSFGPEGFTTPTDAEILAGVQAAINSSFGGALNQSLSTPQGQLATSIAAIVASTYDAFAFLAAQMDPALASGRYQDAIARIYFLERTAAEPTTVQATCVGAPGTVIPDGVLALAADGNTYACSGGGVIPALGSVVLPFACTALGPITCPAGTLNSIFQAVPGWNSINNLADGVLGNVVESRAEFEARREASVAHNSTGSLPSILGAVLDIDGVLDAYVTENVQNAPLTIGGVTLSPHSLYVAAVGGDPDEVARAIWSKKAPGCDYNGNTTRVVLDDRAGYSPPYPSYNVTFETPPALRILFAVTISSGSLVPADAAAQIQAAVLAAFSGADGGSRARIGTTVFASRFYAAVAALGPWAQIVSLLVGSANSASAVFTGSIAGTTLSVSAVSSGALAVGQTISDVAGAILPGTTIASGSGTTWAVSKAQTVSSRAMRSARATLNSAAVNIDQVPTVSVDDISVALA